MDVKRYKVDLSAPAAKRWDEMLADRWACKAAADLATDAYSQLAEALEDLRGVPGFLAQSGAWLCKQTTGLLTSLLGPAEYAADIREWSKYAIGDQSLTALCNVLYEANSFHTGLCTSVAFSRPGLGMIHARNMDWPLHAIRNATVLVDFLGPSGPFTAVSVPGLVGVLSGVGEGRFSATINANSDGSVKFRLNPRGWSAAFLLRWIFEHCRTYDEALKTLRHTPSFVPFFVQLVGAEVGQATVVGVRPGGRNVVYNYKGRPLAISNHYPDNPGYEDLDDGSYYTDSIKRLDRARHWAGKCKAKTLKGCLAILRKPYIGNGNTVQSMVLHPGSGDVMLGECWP